VQQPPTPALPSPIHAQKPLDSEKFPQTRMEDLGEEFASNLDGDDSSDNTPGDDHSSSDDHSGAGDNSPGSSEDGGRTVESGE